ncbi:hypothetical protein K3725_15915 [Leisingera sp. S132]|uniref:AbiU2 domain-containing protein n=1 Tax=Leisingera sp. S132 TaxID=2867016 RepID=UPI0021A302DD|nr:hypothetical protein [Leisingera sp. S132]UWQ78774.1 hypothetical protein K3725_15915 [Leisingera sp. S132]
MEEFSRIHNELDKQCRYYCRHLGHLKGLIENDDWIRVVDGSMSGRVLLLGNSEITNALILFNTRMFDSQPDTVTIHKLARKLPTEQEIETYHNTRMKEEGVRCELEAYFSARSRFVEVRRALKGNKTQDKLRSLRDYTLAHNIVPETKPERATLNDLVGLTETVNELVDLAGYILNSTRSVYRDFSSRAEKETRMLYAALPVLTTVEAE